jgi:hypothetical protein
VRIHIHDILYFIILTIIQNKQVNEAYSMLLDSLRFIDAKVYHDWGKKVVTIQGNGTLKTILVNQRLGLRPQLLEVLVCYNIVEGLTNKEEDQHLSTKDDLFAIDAILLPRELVGASF